jgi:hypothetical protein
MGNRKSMKVKHDNNVDLPYVSKSTGLSLQEVELWYESFMNDCPNGKLSR